jgi:hypothetical protein
MELAVEQKGDGERHVGVSLCQTFEPKQEDDLGVPLNIDLILLFLIYSPYLPISSYLL